MASKGTYLERELIESPALRELSGTGIRLLLLFRLKLRKVNMPKRRGEKNWVVTNNGEIEFTYKEAEKRWGIRQSAFLANRDKLIDVGFLDISHSGAGLYKAKTLYSVSERWKKYATPGFEHVKRERDFRRLGYQGWRKRQQKKGM